MIVVDANVLLYAVNQSSPQHDRAVRWLEEALAGAEPIGFAWIVLLAFLRLATLPALFTTPLEINEALSLIDDWLDASPAIVVQPTARHAGVLGGLLVESGTAGNLVSDVHLAALSVEHGARVCSFDRDFSRFRGVSVFAPL